MNSKSDDVKLKATLVIQDTERFKMLANPRVRLNCNILESHIETEKGKQIQVIDKIQVLSVSIIDEKEGEAE